MAVSAILLILGHLLSTATFDLLFWTLVSFLVVRQLQGADPRGWLLVGLVVGVALHNKTLVAALVAAVLLGLLAVGPRSCPPVGLAVAGCRPGRCWSGCRTCSGRPTTGGRSSRLARAIAGGSSGSSQPWWLFLPMQLVLVSPVLVAIWIPGLVRLWRAPGLRPVRCFAIAYGFLALVFLVTGGKPYYLAGLYPVLLAAGAPAVVGWLRRRPDARGWVVGGLGLSLLVNAVLMLPVLPVRALAVTPDRRHQLRRRRDRGLARFRRDGGRRVRRPTAGRPGPGGGGHTELRPGRGGRSLRSRPGPAEGLQRPQRLLRLGSTARQRVGRSSWSGSRSPSCARCSARSTGPRRSTTASEWRTRSKGRRSGWSGIPRGSWAEIWPTFRRLG